MRHFRSLIPASLVLLTGLALPLSAQHEPHGEKQGKGDKGAPAAATHQKAPHESGKHLRDAAPRQHAQSHEARQPHTERHAARQEKMAGPDRQAHDWQRSKGWQKGDGWKGAKDWKGSKAQHWDNDHRDWKQRGGYGGRRIPPGQYGRYFGPDHFFRLRGRPFLYGGYPRFYYGGYSFLMVDPWPEYWQDNWYSSEDVYVVYDDGYYLYNRQHPNAAVAISVTF